MKDFDKNNNDEHVEALQQLCFTGANEIRSRLRVNEDTYYFYHRVHNQRGRRHYIYAVLDEIERVGIAVKRVHELFKDYNPSDEADETGRRVLRNILESTNDELSLYVRRLTECLVDLINFSKTNTDPYFDHYLLYVELTDYNRQKQDLKTYFNCDNQNLQMVIDLLKRSISIAEQNLDLTKCWYLDRAKSTGAPKPGGDAKLSNFERRMATALPFASKGEHAALGFDYGQAYRRPSGDIHLNIGGVRRRVTLSTLLGHQQKIGLLSSYCLLRCRRLLRIRASGGVVAGIAKKINLDGHPLADLYKAHTRPGIAKGDFVVVRGYLCEVLASRVSQFGYKSFKIKYLSGSPAGEREDSVPAVEVRLLFKAATIRKGVRGLLGVKPRNPRLIASKLRETVVKLWENNGLKELARGDTEEATAKLNAAVHSIRDQLA